MSNILLALCILVLAACTPAATEPPATATPAPLPTFTTAPTATRAPILPEDEYAFAQNARLGRGVNLGNALEAPSEGEWGMVIEEAFFDLIKQAGFDSVRVPTNWTSRAGMEEPYTIDPEFFERVDTVIAQALARDLAVVLNLHHFGGDIYEKPSEHKDRFLAIWKQISERYADQPDGLYFELFNEPYGTMSTTNAWNEMAAEAIAIIRNTNPTRMIVVGPGNYNNYTQLVLLSLPETDRNLIVTFHYYEPFMFTHQGAEWASGSEAWLGNKWEGSKTEVFIVRQAFDTVVAWADRNHRPIYLGEFGAYSKADLESRALWTETVAREAEVRGFSWAYWEFGAGFGVYDRERKDWNTEILEALIP